MRRKRIIYLLIFIFCYNFLYSQTEYKKDKNYIEYFKEVKKAKLFFKNKEYEKAYNKFNDLYEEYGTDISIVDNTYQMFLRSAELSNQCYSRFKGVKFLIERCGYDLSPLKYEDHDLHTIFKKSGIDVEYYKILQSKYLSSIDIKLRKQLNKMIKRDQLYRRSKDSLGIAKRASIDKLNEKMLIKMFNRNVYPNTSVIGNYWVDEKTINILPLLIHASDSTKKHVIIPKLREFVVNGSCLPSIYNILLKLYKLKNKNTSFKYILLQE